ncbi:MAG: cobalamin B12-binding domain-containing protein [Acidimicrobiia bacterium]
MRTEHWEGPPIRVLLAKPTHDCHDRGIRVVARKLREAGFEVIFTNFLLPAEVVTTALQEDVQVVGISSSSGGHMPVFADVLAGLRDNGMEDVIVLAGGVIPPDDENTLRKWGVADVFGPGTTAKDAIDLIRNRLEVAA